ncbi:MAG TPA: ABC transporter ATP-binding protein [Actinomycetales bacterium]|nr:ABC transporter ATP-binding protein [Actinomycetales bacterium]
MAYGDNLVLDGIDLTIHRGEVAVLLGPNGAGKTTTVEILEGFRQRSAGHVSVLGVDPAHATEAWRARVGIVLQSWRDHASWKVRELIDYLGAYYAPYSTPTTARPWPTASLLETVGLAGEAEKRVSQLSGGRRRRLDVAAGLVGRPELLFLDEPTAGFDPIARRDFHDLILSLADLDTTILMTTHDLDEASKVADRILILADSRIVADGSPDELRRREFGAAEIRWSDGEALHVHATEDPTTFLRGILADPAARVEDLEVRRTSLEDVYIALVNQAEGVSTTGQERLLKRLQDSMNTTTEEVPA